MPVRKIELDSDNNIRVSFPYDVGYLSWVKEIPTAKYDPTRKNWVIKPEYLAATIKRFGGFARATEVDKLYNEYLENEKAAAITGSKLATEFNETKVGARTLYDHQISGIKEILMKRRLILADEMGLGKTTTALVAGKHTGLPIYVIAPKSIHATWEREAYILGVKIKPVISWAKVPPAPTSPFFCIMDEAHMLQTMTTTRTTGALRFCNKAQYVVAITGTPIKNGKPANLFGLLCAIKHPLANKKRSYEELFCGVVKTKYSKRDVRGASNLTLLNSKTKDSILMRFKEDCLNLPDKIRTLRTAELTAEAQGTYESIFNMLKQRWMLRVANKEIMSSNEKLVMFMQLRHAASWAKLHEAYKIGEELYNNNRPVVFFLAFNDTADELVKQLSKIGSCGKVTGNTSTADRQNSIDKFQKGDLNFIVCTFGAGGLGITLTAASHCVLLDRPWTSGDALQAEDRIHRIGQKDTAFIDWLQCNSTDVKIDNMLLNKQKNISTILTGNKDELSIQFDVRTQIDSVLDDIFKEK